MILSARITGVVGVLRNPQCPDKTCWVQSVHSGKYINVIITSIFALLNAQFLLGARLP